MSSVLNFGADDESGIPDAPTVQSSSAGNGGGFTRKAAQSSVVGRNPPTFDTRLFGNLDINAGMAGRKKYELGKDDRMSSAEAWEATTRILKMFGINNAIEGDIFTFMSAMFAYHTINSGSVLQPGRSTIKCLGNEFEFRHVIDLLGNDYRRYFRAYADSVREENIRILSHTDPTDVVGMQLRDWIKQVAAERDLYRFPDLAHDTSECCSRLSPAEIAAVARSKKMVIGTTVNTVDSMVPSGRTQGADRYDSTAGTSVEHASGTAAARSG